MKYIIITCHDHVGKTNTIYSPETHLLQPKSKTVYVISHLYSKVAKWRFGNKPQDNMSSVLDNSFFFFKEINSFNIECNYHRPSNILTRSAVELCKAELTWPWLSRDFQFDKMYESCVLIII